MLVRHLKRSEPRLSPEQVHAVSERLAEALRDQERVEGIVRARKLLTR